VITFAADNHVNRVRFFALQHALDIGLAREHWPKSDSGFSKHHPTTDEKKASLRALATEGAQRIRRFSNPIRSHSCNLYGPDEWTKYRTRLIAFHTNAPIEYAQLGRLLLRRASDFANQSKFPQCGHGASRIGKLDGSMRESWPQIEQRLGSPSGVRDEIIIEPPNW
jgi:hypothetical protein